MIQPYTRVTVADNSGAKELMCIRVIGESKRDLACLGDVIVASIKSAAPHSQVKKKEVVKAVVVRQRAPYTRVDGTNIRFDDNAVVVLEKGKKDPKAGRVFGPIPRELAEKGFQKIISLAQEVI